MPIDSMKKAGKKTNHMVEFIVFIALTPLAGSGRDKFCFFCLNDLTTAGGLDSYCVFWQCGQDCLRI